MTENCLVLITKKYPFDYGEEFIENEIPIIAKRFERVIIIATSVTDNPVKTRAIPENAEARFVRAREVKKGILVSAMKFLAHGKLKKLCGQKEFELIRHSFPKKLFLLYFTAKSECVYKKCSAILNEFSLEKCKAISFYSYWFYDTALAAVKLKETCGAEVKSAVSRAHRYDLYHEQNPAGYIPLRTNILKRIDMVYPCSEDGSGYLKKLYPEYSSKIETAYLGTKDFGVAPAGGGAFHIVSCCHISPVKRVDLLARSLYELRNAGLKLKWTHFGGGDGLEELKKYSNESLSFMEYEFAGEVKNPQLMDYYQNNSVDCFVNTSSSEGLPVSIMEAASFGIPVIATNVGGTSEIVKDGETGFLLKEDFRPPELAEKIKRLYSMPEREKSALRENSRSLWLEHFNSDENYARFAEKINNTPAV